MRTKAISILLPISLIVIVSSCSQDKTEWNGTIENKDGVTIVKNPKESMFQGEIFTLEEDLSIGQIEGTEEYRFGYLWKMLVDEKENIYIINYAGSEMQIKVFDRLGTYIRSIGRMGQGPGEFTQASRLQITPNNELMVLDTNSSKLIYFSLDGDFLRRAPFLGVRASNVQVNSNGNYFFFSAEYQGQRVSEAIYAANKLELFGPDLNFIKLIAKDEYRDIHGSIAPPWMIIRFPSIDLAICGFSETYELQIYDLNGHLVQKIFKDFDPVEIDEYEKEKRDWTRAKGLPKYFPAFEDLSVDEEGRIYVQTFERQMDKDEFYFDVFEPDGKYIAKIPLKTFPEYWKNGKMYTFEEDENGYLYIKRYKVAWNH
ncbi:MAG: 6-bladed beta-propeller [Candidatus Aminicenantes bacterium]|nr:6-bladed beta-propeller [Candidatus Aminicenantes bacterium]